MLRLDVKSRILYIYAGCVLVFVTLALFGYYAVDKSGHFKPFLPTQTQRFASDMTYYDLPRMNVLVGKGVDQTHVRLDISLEIPKDDLIIMEGFEPRINDRLTSFLVSVRPEQYKIVSSMPWLRGEILHAANTAGAPFLIHGVFLRQMLIM